MDWNKTSETSDARKRDDYRLFLRTGAERQSPAIAPSAPKVRPPRSEVAADIPSRRWAPWTVVGIAVAFGLWFLRNERIVITQSNDAPIHQAMVRWAMMRIQGGHLPTDGWFPNVGLGSSLFHHYESLPHTIAGFFGLFLGPDVSFQLFLYLLLATFPLSVYLGIRLMGWERWVGAGAALVAPLVVSQSIEYGAYGFEHGSYIAYGHGMWPQLFGMWILPITWGLTFRAVSGTLRSRTFALAALALGMTCALHFIVGYIALLAIPVWVLVEPRDFVKRLGRAALLVAGGLLIASWVLVPLLLDAKYSTVSSFLTDSIWTDSFGASTVTKWLAAGKLFDGSEPARIPVISLVVLVGLVVAAARFIKDERARAVLGVTALGFWLFMGKDALGPFYNLIPGHDDLLLHRFIAMFHMGGIMLAGIAVGAVANQLRGVMRPFWKIGMRVGQTVAVALVVLLFLGPAWSERVVYDTAGGEYIKTQTYYDATEGENVRSLITAGLIRGPGRFTAGTSADAGKDDRIWGTPVYTMPLNEDADSVGFLLRVATPSEDVEAWFNRDNYNLYQLFNIKYLILPTTTTPPPFAAKFLTVGQHTLYTVATSGYLDVVDPAPPIAADRTNLAERVKAWMYSENVPQKKFPVIAYDGTTVAEATINASAGSGLPGVVQAEASDLENGFLAGRVNLTRPAMVIMKSSFDPRWQMWIDGVKVKTRMVAPSFIGHEVDAGTHSIRFEYKPFPRYDLLLSVGILTFLGLLLVPEARKRKRLLAAMAAFAPPPPPEEPEPEFDGEPEPISVFKFDVESWRTAPWEEDEQPPRRKLWSRRTDTSEPIG